MISSFLALGTDVEYTFPSSFKDIINKIVKEYMLDIENFRIKDKQKILDEIYKMKDIRTKVTTSLMKKEKWDFFMTVFIGLDRIHHAFWGFMDKEHKLYVPNHKYENVIFDYYKYMDKTIGKIIKAAGKDAIVIIASDHDAKKIDGAIAINDWLIKEGYLTIKNRPTRDERLSLKQDNIVWNETKAWV